MITLEELLKTEDQYIAKHKNDNPFMPNTQNDNLDFLRQGYIRKHYEGAKEYYEAKHDLLQSYGITEIEVLILFLFEGFMPQIFRVDLVYGKIPPLLKDIWMYLDNILEKTPSFDGKVLYRFSSYDNANDFRIGEIFQPIYFFTTTVDNWEKDCTTFIVTPLPKDTTSAKSLYLIKNHGEEYDAGENQVTFKRNSKFLITNIEQKTEKKPDKIYLEEIK